MLRTIDANRMYRTRDGRLAYIAHLNGVEPYVCVGAYSNNDGETWVEEKWNAEGKIYDGAVRIGTEGLERPYEGELDLMNPVYKLISLPPTKEKKETWTNKLLRLFRLK